MKTVANFASLQQAQILRLRLEADGIPAVIPNEITATMAPHHFMTETGICVDVPDDDELAAQKLINKYNSLQKAE